MISNLICVRRSESDDDDNDNDGRMVDMQIAWRSLCGEHVPMMKTKENGRIDQCGCWHLLATALMADKARNRPHFDIFEHAKSKT